MNSMSVSDVQNFLNQAVAHLQNGEGENARYLIEKVLPVLGPTRDVQFLYALCFINLLRLPDAKIALETELKHFPDNAAARDMLEAVNRDLEYALSPSYLAQDDSDGPRIWQDRLQEVLRNRSTPLHVHQMVASFVYGDGVGSCMLHMRSLLREWGIVSNIYSEHGGPGVAGQWIPFERHVEISSPENFLLYHPSDGLSKTIEYFRNAQDRKVLHYHNITPASFFAPYNEVTAQICEAAELAVKSFYDIVEASLADSEFNASGLREMGYKNVRVLPLPFFRESFRHQSPEPAILEKFRDGKTNILFVGRFAPNKCQHELIKAFAHYRSVNPNSRLILVGTKAQSDNYSTYVDEVLAELQVPEVHILGHTTFAELVACYNVADVLLCLSQHEGFCLPLLEAMNFNVPVVAGEGHAISETLSRAGILVPHGNYVAVAEAIEKLRLNADFRSDILRSQAARVKDFSLGRIRETLARFLCERLEGIEEAPEVFTGNVTEQSLPVEVSVAMSSSSLPKISIVSPSMNCAHLLRRCVEGVLAQNYPNFEHIIVDGASTDGTVDILKSYPHLRWISERDSGEAEALNKAVRMATGDIVNWLNVDDFYLGNEVLHTVAMAFAGRIDIDMVYGKGMAVNEAGEVLWYRRPVIEFTLPNIMRWTANPNLFQPAMFMKRRMMEELGPFREDLKYGIDYEYWLRIAATGYKCQFLDQVLALATLVREGAKSGGSYEDQHMCWQELCAPFSNRLERSQCLNYWRDFYHFRVNPPVPYKHAIEIPKSEEALIGFVIASLEHGNMDLAAIGVEQLTSGYPNCPDGYWLLSEVLNKMGDTHSALQSAGHAYDLATRPKAKAAVQPKFSLGLAAS